MIEECRTLRQELKPLADKVRQAARTGSIEANENILLAFRHMEDASMRLGKAIQALDGGESVYDKKEVPGA
jgi:hypothetical protein